MHGISIEIFVLNFVALYFCGHGNEDMLQKWVKTLIIYFISFENKKILDER